MITVNVVCMFFASKLKKGKKYVKICHLALYTYVSTDLIGGTIFLRPAA